MYTWSCNECETLLWSRQLVPGGGSCPACGAWLPQTATKPPRPATRSRGSAAPQQSDRRRARRARSTFRLMAG
jgi:hypothetical protein